MPIPAFQNATGYIAEQVVTLHFDSALDSSNPPPLSAFSIHVNGTGVAVTGVSVDSVSKAVSLSFGYTLVPGDIVEVAYTDPTSGNDPLAIQGLDGLDALDLLTFLVVSGLRPVPSVVSITRADGAGANVPANASEITYQVVFSEEVTGVGTGDFSLTPTGTAGGAISGVSGSGTTYLVKVIGLSGDGTLRLDLNSSGTGIQNSASVEVAGGYTAGQTFALDRTAPAAPSAPQLAAASDTGWSSSDAITRTANPTFTGTAEAGADVRLYNGESLLGSAMADGSGAWTITSSTLAEGSHELTVRQADAAGNVSVASPPVTVTVDTTAPTATISIDVTGLKAGATGTITFTFSEDPGDTFTWDGASGDLVVTGGTLGATEGSGLTRTATFTPDAGIDDGSASITLSDQSYSDAAGNAGAGANLSVRVDTVAPPAPSTPHFGGGDADNATTVSTPTFTGTAAVGARVTLYGSDGTTILGWADAFDGTWSITSSALPFGHHLVTTVASDPAGNSSAASSALSVTIVPPVQAAIDSLGLGGRSGFDAAQVEADLGAGTYSYAQFVDQLVAEARDTALPAVVATAILGQVRPTEAHLSDLIDFTFMQLAAYQQMGVARPELGPYEALGVGFSETEAFGLGYAGMSNEAFSQAAYLLVFNRAATQAQIDHFNAQIDYFEGIYQNAGLGAAEADVRAKGAAIGQMIGHAVLDEPALHYLDDDANAFLQQVAMGQANFGAPLGLI